MDVTIVISILHSKSFIENILFHLNKLKCKQIFLINGVSNTNSLKLITDYAGLNKDIKLMKTSSLLRFPVAINTLIKEVKTKYVLPLDSDVFMTNNSLEKMYKFIVKNTEYGGVQGVLKYPQTGRIQTTGHLFYEYADYHSDNFNFFLTKGLKPLPRQALCSGFTMFPTDIIKNAGLFNEFLLHARGGVDLTFRIHRMGYKLCCLPFVEAFHFKGLIRKNILNLVKKDFGLFWSQHGELVRDDLVEELKRNITQYSFNSFYIIDCSTIRDIEKFLFEFLGSKRKTDLKLFDIHVSNIILEEHVPSLLINSRRKILWICTNFTQLINNYYVFTKKSRKNDVIIDMSSNIISIETLVRNQYLTSNQ